MTDQVSSSVSPQRSHISGCLLDDTACLKAAAAFFEKKAVEEKQAFAEKQADREAQAAKDAELAERHAENMDAIDRSAGSHE